MASGIERTVPGARLARAIAVALFAWLLSSSSCIYVACHEDCDPCFQSCKCSNICQGSTQAAQARRIVAFRAQVERADATGTRRRLSGILGPALDLAGGPELAGAGDATEPDTLARFAQSVLEANAELVPRSASTAWVLTGVEHAAGARVAHFSAETRHGARAARTNAVSMLFDERGRLLELVQEFELGDD